jgi:hypothetical protein
MAAAYIDPIWSFCKALVALGALAYFKSHNLSINTVKYHH